MLKLDRSLLSTRTGSEDDRCARLRAVVALGDALGIDVLATGVEMPEQLARARTAGCAYGQGYMIAAPMPDNHVLEWLAGPAALAHAAPRRSGACGHGCDGAAGDRTEGVGPCRSSSAPGPRRPRPRRCQS